VPKLFLYLHSAPPEVGFFSCSHLPTGTAPCFLRVGAHPTGHLSLRGANRALSRLHFASWFSLLCGTNQTHSSETHPDPCLGALLIYANNMLLDQRLKAQISSPISVRVSKLSLALKHFFSFCKMPALRNTGVSHCKFLTRWIIWTLL